MSADGIFCVSRGVFKHPMFDGEPYSRRDAWLWLLGNAVWKTTRVRVGHTIVDLERGQLTHSERFLADKWKWSKSKVHRFLQRLQDEEMVKLCCAQTGPATDHTANHETNLITICNYDSYQFGRTSDGPPTEPPAGPEADQVRTKEETLKQRKKEIAADAAPVPSSATAALPLGDEPKVQAREYEFAGQIIRLSKAHFDRWARAYPLINLRAALTARDDWLAQAADRDRERWFVSTSKFLANENEKAARQRAGFKWASGIEGVY